MYNALSTMLCTMLCTIICTMICTAMYIAMYNALSTMACTMICLITNRKDYRTATHLITGHCGLNKHLYNMNKTTTKECPLCGHYEETVNHFLGQCPALAQTRGQYFNDYYLSVNDIFDNIHITSLQRLSIMLTKPDDSWTLKT